MRTAIFTALIALLTSSVTVLAQPGSLDLSFNSDGIVETLTDPYGSAQAVAVQPDGRIVVAGLLPNGSLFNVQVLRYMPDGTVDNSFGTQGKTVVPTSSVDYTFVGIALQSDGRIVVAHDIGGDFAVLRFTTTGVLDPSFGGDGVVSTSFSSGNDVATSVAVQADGKIVVAGFTTPGANREFALARYNTDGSLDDNFSYDGKLTTSVGGSDADNAAYAIAISTDGSIFAAGREGTTAGANAAVVKYMPDGTLDASFGTSGIVELSFGAADLSLAYSIALQNDGRVVIGGTAQLGNVRIGAARLNTDGSLDLSFAGTGTVLTSLSGGETYGNAMALQADGKIVMTGAHNADVALVRYAVDGTLDPSFGAAGSVVTSLSTQAENIQSEALAIAMQPDGKIVVTGKADGVGSDNYVVVLRYISGVNTGIIPVEGSPLGLHLYPDPAQDHLMLSSMKALSAQAVVTLVNSTGQSIPLSAFTMQRSADRREYTIDLRGLAPGQYLLRLVDGTAMRTLPFIKD